LVSTDLLIVSIISSIVGVLVGFLLRDLISLIRVYRYTRQIESSYSKLAGFVRENYDEPDYILRRLPNRIVIEAVHVEGRLITSSLLSRLKKTLLSLRGERYIGVIIPTNMNYYEQITYILKEALRMILALDRVLGYEFRESLVSYYAYKFAVHAGKTIDRQVVDLLERDFQNSKYRDVIIRLDSKELEAKITLNPPPEVQPLLGRVIIPILELRNKELEGIADLARLEKEKSRIEKILTLISRGEIGVLFIGKKEPGTYASYVVEKIANFKGLLVCSRGMFAKAYKEYYHKVIKAIVEEHLGNVVEEWFEGYIELPDRGGVFHLYVLLLKENLLD